MSTRKSSRAVLALLVVLSSFFPTLPVPSAFAADPDPFAACAGISSAIACENSKPGNPLGEWMISGAGDASIQGFATDISLNRGQTARFKVNTVATAYRMDIYRMGYYGGSGARLIATVPNAATLERQQTACLNEPTTGLIDCGNWTETASWAVPANATSGIYFARLVREDATPGSSHIFFVVRDDASRSDLLFQTADTTWQAYNSYGGKSLYDGLPNGSSRAYKVSYNRPFSTRNGQENNWVFNAEYPTVRWLEANGYDVTYSTGLDSDRRGDLIRNHRAFLSVGHDEYWSGAQRAAVEAARDAGVHLAFFAGNDVYWKTRWEPSIDGSETPYRTLVTYKETQSNADVDPTAAWTGTWRDPRFSALAGGGGRPENELTGTIFTVQGSHGGIQVPEAEGKLRFWRNTSVASQTAGQVAVLGSDTLGFEWNEDLDNGFRPAGLLRMSLAKFNVGQRMLDYGSTVGPGPASHSLTLYRAPSGALVFSAGTIQWAWGLDSEHDRGNAPPSPQMQQATLNLLADMGVQPATRQAGLVAATASSDTARPTSTITAPAAGASLPSGAVVTVEGTASDAGGLVGGVEVSTDGGATWHPAEGRGTWTYKWTPTALGATTIKTRAVDDSGNLETPSAGRAVTVTARTCPCSLWNDSFAPTIPWVDDGNGIELGMRFGLNTSGHATGVRFYKGPGNVGTHIGHLWDNAGNKLAEVTFANETAQGWQTATFAAPVPLSANTPYIVSYYAPVGRYPGDSYFFATSGVNNTPLHGLAHGVGGPQGSYVYTTDSRGAFPALEYQATNYWVDVIVTTDGPVDTVAPTIAGAQATGIKPTGATITWTTSEWADTQVEYGLTTGYGSSTPVNALLVTTHAQGLTGLTPNTTYHYRVKSRDMLGNAVASGDFTFTTAPPDTVAPLISAVQASGVTLTGATIGWTTDEPSDTQVEYGTTTGYGSSTVLDPAQVTAHSHVLGGLASGTLYHYRVKSRDAAGNLATSPDLTFTTAAPDTTPPTISAVQTSAIGPSGATVIWTTDEAADSQVEYGTTTSYGSSATLNPAMVTSHSQALAGLTPSTLYHYRVKSRDAAGNLATSPDLTFTTAPPDTVAPTVSAVQASAVTFSGATVIWTSDEPSDSQVEYGTTTSYGSSTTLNVSLVTAHAQTLSGLTPGTLYHFRVKSADAAGNRTTSADGTFTTPSCPCSVLGDAQPQGASVGSGGSVELGLKFQADAAGFVTGLRFYKAAGDSGAHVGSLWTETGTLLASAPFTDESTSGWQQVALPTPVPVTAGTTYVVSYHSSAGTYLANSGYFGATVQSGPLRAPASASVGGNGVFTYSPTSTFPTSTFGAANYWVDVVFNAVATDGVAPTIAPPQATALAGTSATIVWTTNEWADSQVEYGPTTAYGSTSALDRTMVTSHSHRLTGLATNTLYHYRVKSRDAAGNLATSPDFTFTTLDCPCSILGDTQPRSPSLGSGGAVELGLKFQADSVGFVTGVRFHKAVGDGGAHVGSLWTDSGTLLARATFTNESASGWQQVAFPTPVPVTAGTTYVVSYHSSAGTYLANGGYFTSPVLSPPLRAPSSDSVGGNGVYAYSADPAFPTGNSNGANYWADVVFVRGAARITEQPSNPSSSASPSFTFTGSAGNTFQCSLDGSAFADCASPKSYTGLGDGSHTFRVRSVSPDGTPDPIPASYTWTVDTVRPDTTITSGPTGLSNSAGATFVFGSTESGVTFECALDGAFASCASPKSYTGLGDGSHTFQVRAIDAAGNVDDSPAGVTWPIDATAPAAPSTPDLAQASDSGVSATDNFTSVSRPTIGGLAEAGSTITVFDGATPLGTTAAGADGAWTFAPTVRLSDGAHSVTASARDAAGNTSPASAPLVLTIDTTAPAATATNLAGWFTTTPVNVTITATDAVGLSSIVSILDGVRVDHPASGTSASITLTLDSPGVHALTYFALDLAGNASFSGVGGEEIKIDTLAPTGTISVAGGAAYTTGQTVALTLSATDDTSGVGEMSFSDDGTTWTAWEPYQTSRSYSLPAGDGLKTVHARFRDLAGNQSAGASDTITIDTTAPRTTIESGPPSPTRATSATFTFSSAQSDSTFQCRLDAGSFGPCASGVTYSGLAEGTHTFQVRAVDPAGNPDSSPPTTTWIVDLTAPVLTLPTATVTAEATGATGAVVTYTASASDGVSGPVVPSCLPASGGTFPIGATTVTCSATDPAGNAGSGSFSVEVVDTTAPQLSGLPTSTTLEATGPTGASRTWTAPTAADLVDGSVAVVCVPVAGTTFALGLTNVSCSATDTRGNLASAAFTVTVVDTTAPSGSVSIDAGAAYARSASVGLTLAATDAASGLGEMSFSNNGTAWTAWEPYQTSRSYSLPAGDGLKTVHARFRDRAGNQSAGVTDTITIDTAAPNTTITASPTSPTASTDATFSFTSSESGGGFECRLDAAAWAACTSPRTYSGLAEIGHTFQVRAIDPAGNADASPASHTWTVQSAGDTIGPVISAVQVGGITDWAATVSWTTSEPASSQVEYGLTTAYGSTTSLDSAMLTAHSQLVSGLTPGKLYYYRVKSQDAAGNATVSPQYTFTTTDAPPTHTTSVAVGTRPNDAAVNPNTDRIYATNELANSVSVIDGATNALVTTIPVGAAPKGVAVNTTVGVNRVYVTNFSSNSVSVINGATNSVVATVTVGSGPYGVAVNETTNRVYVVNQTARSVSVIDGTTNTVVKTITGLGMAPTGIAVNPTSARAYVTNSNQNSVSVINTDTNALIAGTIGVGAGPRGIAVNPTTNLVYTANFSGNSVTIINTATTPATVTTVSLSAGASPFDVVVNPGTNRFYVSYAGPDQIAAFNGASPSAPLGTVAVGADPYGLAINTKTVRIYSGNTTGNNVSVVQD